MTIAAGKATPPAIDNWIVFHGDSITNGWTTTNRSTNGDHAFPYLANATAVANHGWYTGFIQRGYDGASYSGVYLSLTPLTTDAITRIDPFLAQTGTKWLVIFAGTNDIFGGGKTGAQTAALLQTYVADRIAAGWSANHIIVCTMLPRGGSDTARDALNADIRSNAVSVGYLVADLAANATIGVANANTNLTYYAADQIHPIDAGHTIIASIVAAVL